MPQVSEEELAFPVETEKSGVIDGFLSGLTNDETARIRWLAERRFPEMVKQGMDPVDLYALDKDGDISFYDARSKKWMKEFDDTILPRLQTDEVWGKVGPTAQFLSEVIPGTLGLLKGFAQTKTPWGAGLEAMTWAARGGATSYAARAGLSELLGGPPLDVEKASKDLLLSSAFAGLPIGIPSQAFPRAMQGLVSKFPGTNGRTALHDIINHGGKTVDEKIARAKEKWGIDLTRAEAEGTVSNVSQLQKYLQKRVHADKLWEHYHNRQRLMEDHAQGFFDELLSGKYVDESLKNTLTGKASVDASLDVAKATKTYLEKLKKQMYDDVKPLYKDAYDLDVKIDVSDILAKVRKVTDPKANVSEAKRAAYKKIEKALIDNTTGKPRDTTELLHLALKDDFNRLLASTTKDADKALKREVTLLRNQISNRMKEANPLYKKVTEIFDDTIGTTQSLERSIVGILANTVEKGGPEAARITQRMFSGAVQPDEITKLKGILQETPEGAQAWQNLKGAWLRTKFDDAVTGTTNPLGAPNKFLSSIGIRNVKKAFTRSGDNLMDASPAELSRLAGELGEIKAKGKKAEILKAILEPEELSNFVDLSDTMQAMNWIALQGSPDTQLFQNIEKLISMEAATLGVKGKSFLYGLMNMTGKTATGQLGKETAEAAARTQHDLYEDVLIDALIDPNRTAELSQYFLKANPWAYWGVQTISRSGLEGLNEGMTSIEEREAQIKSEQLQREYESQQPPPQDLENLQGSIQGFQVPQIDQPLFETESDLAPTELLSPTVLPDERDREIAMRQQLGIAGLV